MNAVPATFVAGALVLLATAAAATPDAEAQSDDALALRLDDVGFAVEAGQPVVLELALLGAVDDVLPTTTTTTTTATTTTTVASRRPTRPPSTAADEARPLTGGQPAETTNAIVTVAVHLPADDPIEVADAFAGEPDDAFDRVELPLDQVLDTTGDEPVLRMSIPTSAGLATDDSLTLRDPGLYPISIELSVDDELVASHMTMIQRTESDAVTSFDVALFAGMPEVGPAPDRTELQRGHDDLAAMADLGAATDAVVTWSIPPGLLDRVVADDPELGARLRSSLAGDETISLPVAALDPSSAVAIDAVDTFTTELREGEDLLRRLLPDTPSRRAAWVVDDPLSEPAADALRDLGFRLLVLDRDVYRQLDGNIGRFTDPTLVLAVGEDDDTTLPAFTFSGWRRLLDPTRAAGDRRSPTDRAVRIVTDMLALHAEVDPAPRRAAVLATPGFGIPDAAVVAALTRFVDQSPELQMTSLSELPGAADPLTADGRPVTVTLPATAGPDLTARATRLRGTRLGAASAGSMLPADDPRPAEWTTDLDTLLSTGYDDAEADAVMDDVLAEADLVRDAIQPPPPLTFTLTGRTDELRLRIGNNSAVPLTVTVRPSSPKIVFPGGEQQVLLTPQGFTNVELPVEARSNGTSSVSIELSTPLGEPLGDPLIITAHVTALSGLGQVITGGALLVLLTWWASHVRRNRLRRRATSPATAAFADDGELVANGDGPVVSPDAAEATVSPPSVADRVPDP